LQNYKNYENYVNIKSKLPCFRLILLYLVLLGQFDFFLYPNRLGHI